MQKISLADVQSAAAAQAQQVCRILADLRREQDKDSEDYRCYVSDRLLEDVANRLDRWMIMLQVFEAIASEEDPKLCLLEGIPGFGYCYISSHDLGCKGFDSPLASMYDRSVFTSLPYLEVKGEKVLLLHQDSQKASVLKGIAREETREFTYTQWNSFTVDTIYSLKVKRII